MEHNVENRVQGGYVRDYPFGEELATRLLAEKPFDLHTIMGQKLGISRSDAKSFNYACLPIDNTEVLTNTGWKYYDQIKEGDIILSYNLNKDCLEKDSIQKLHCFNDKDIIKVSNTRDFFESTGDHRWFGRRRIGRKKRWFSTEFFTTEQITSEHNILMSAVYSQKDSNITPLEARILGWILSDGQIVWSKFNRNKIPGLTVNIFQSKNKFYKEIEKDLKNIGYKFNTYLKKVDNSNDIFQYYILPKDIRYLFDKLDIKLIHKHDVDWVKIVLNMSDECRDNFIDTFYMGDGFKNNRGAKNQIRQNFGNIHDAVTLALYLQGNRISMSCGKSTNCSVIVKHSTRYLTGQKLIKETLEPRPTFCLTTNNSTFVIRQNKKFISITGNCLYGAYITKLAAMLNKSFEETKQLYEDFWNSVPALRDLKADLIQQWLYNDKKFIAGIDGRRIYTRSEHSLLNYLFQSGGVIAAKYVTVFIFEELQSQGYCISPFKGIPDVCSMIEYHDENQLAVRKALRVLRLTSFKTEEEAQEYKKNYTGDQLSNIKVFSDPSKGFYICEPNPVSLAIKKATDRTEKLLSLKFELGFEWDLGKNWFQCH
jgi:hypothetical protein